MKSIKLGAAYLVLAGVLILPVAGSPAGATAAIAIDYPQAGSIFPPKLPAPTFLWRDPAGKEGQWWRVVIEFPGSHAAAIQVKTKGEGMRIGEIDPCCLSETNEPPKLTPEQAAAHTWKPEKATWEAIKKQSVKKPALVTITGFRDVGMTDPVSRGSV